MPELSLRPPEKLDRPTIDVPRLDTSTSFAKEAYAALKRAITAMMKNLFIRMQAIRKIMNHQDNRAAGSITDHMRIIEALERRDPELAEQLAREHTLGLAAHVEQHGDFLDVGCGDDK